MAAETNIDIVVGSKNVFEYEFYNKDGSEEILQSGEEGSVFEFWLKNIDTRESKSYGTFDVSGNTLKIIVEISSGDSILTQLSKPSRREYGGLYAFSVLQDGVVRIFGSARLIIGGK